MWQEYWDEFLLILGILDDYLDLDGTNWEQLLNIIVKKYVERNLNWTSSHECELKWGWVKLRNKLWRDYGHAKIKWWLFAFKNYVVIECEWYSLTAKGRKHIRDENFGGQEAIALCSLAPLLFYVTINKIENMNGWLSETIGRAKAEKATEIDDWHINMCFVLYGHCMLFSL